MTSNYNKAIYKEALDTWGPDLQLNMAIEEAMEWGLAISRFVRGRATVAELVDEMADNLIMIEQVTEYIGSLKNDPLFYMEVDAKKVEKLERLKNRLAKL